MIQAVSSLAKRRKELIQEISGIEVMRCGNLNIRHNKIKNQKGEIVTNGPYYNLTRKDVNGKTVSQTIPASEVERVREEVENYRTFKKFCDEYAGICEQIAITKASLRSSDDECKKN
jgi:hypothetical protein